MKINANWHPDSRAQRDACSRPKRGAAHAGPLTGCGNRVKLHVTSSSVARPIGKKKEKKNGEILARRDDVTESGSGPSSSEIRPSARSSPEIAGADKNGTAESQGERERESVWSEIHSHKTQLLAAHVLAIEFCSIGQGSVLPPRWRDDAASALRADGGDVDVLIGGDRLRRPDWSGMLQIGGRSLVVGGEFL